MGLFVFQFLKNSSADKALADALGRSQAVIEFGMDGTIRHRQRQFPESPRLRARRNPGQASQHVRRCRRSATARPIAISGRRSSAANTRPPNTSGSARAAKEVWIQATYNPVLDADGKPVKVVKFATDITARKIKSMEDAGQIAAIGRAQAVIAFEMDGTIVTANENFLRAMGYTLAEIQGKHHSMFVEQARARQRGLPRVLGKAQPRRKPVGRIQADRQGRQGSLDPRLLQPGARREGQAVQGGEIRHRRHQGRNWRPPTLPGRSQRSASRRP